MKEEKCRITEGKFKANKEKFRTAVSECQATVNNRPLIYVSNELQEEPLMPSHMLRGGLIQTLPLSQVPTEDTAGESITRDARHCYTRLSQAIQMFQRRWKAEYLTALQ